MTKIEVGQPAPDFKFTANDGTERNLSELRGNKIILYFYPKDNTPGCTAQACSLRDAVPAFKQKGIEIIGVSADSEKKHENFKAKYQLPFPLVADTNREVINQYGVWGEKKFMGRTYDGILRTTFIIDENGVVQHIIDKVKTKAHAEQIQELLNEKQ